MKHITDELEQKIRREIEAWKKSAVESGDRRDGEAVTEAEIRAAMLNWVLVQAGIDGPPSVFMIQNHNASRDAARAKSLLQQAFGASVIGDDLSLKQSVQIALEFVDFGRGAKRRVYCCNPMDSF